MPAEDSPPSPTDHVEYAELDVPVRGGSLHCGVWGSDGPFVLAVHGITATHMAWLAVAERSPSVRVVAPDLRGRGRSAELPGPYGFDGHAADLVAVLDAVGAARTVVVGHSMGGFVATHLAARHPDRVSRLVLVDGGPPLGRPEDPAPPGGIDAALGPAAARLAMTFPDREAYREYWRAHPAMAPIWSPVVEAYVDYDLTGEPPELRSSCREAAMRVDGAEVADHAAATQALRDLEIPVTFLRAERGMFNEPRALYPPGTADAWLLPGLGIETTLVPDTNHYSVLLEKSGAAAVSAAMLDAVNAAEAGRSGRSARLTLPPTRPPTWISAVDAAPRRAAPSARRSERLRPGR